MSCVLTMRPFVLDDERHLPAGVADLRHDDVEHERRALERARGVSTRVTWTSRVSRSLPTPTANTGMPCALRPAIDSSIVRSALSEPSVTSTRPATGRPLSSLRARSSASPSRVAVPSNVRSRRRLQPLGRRREPEDAEIEALAERREQRRVGPAELLRDERAARLAVVIGHLHAARVVEQDADEVLLRHRDLEQQHRPQQAEQHDQEQTDADAEQHDAVAAARARRPGGTSTARTAPRRRRTAAVSHIERLAPKANLPCSKTSHWYLNRNAKNRVEHGSGIVSRYGLASSARVRRHASASGACHKNVIIDRRLAARSRASGSGPRRVRPAPVPAGRRRVRRTRRSPASSRRPRRSATSADRATTTGVGWPSPVNTTTKPGSLTMAAASVFSAAASQPGCAIKTPR